MYQFPDLHRTCLTTTQVVERAKSAIVCGEKFGMDYSIDEMIPYVIAAEIKYPSMGVM